MENTGFMAYDVLAGGARLDRVVKGLASRREIALAAAAWHRTWLPGVLTGKYLKEAAAVDSFQAGKKDAALRRFREPRGRMDENGWGQTLYRYRSGPAEEATRAYARLAQQSGMPLTELSLRWARQRPAVTTCLLGTSSLAQLNEDLAYFREPKPLPRELMWEIDRVHMRNRLPVFASTRVAKDWNEGSFGFGEVDEVIP